MTKRTKTIKTLRLSTETVRRISEKDLKKVAGGPNDRDQDIISIPCDFTFGCM